MADDGPITIGRYRPRGRARVDYLSRRIRRVLRNRWDILTVIAAGGAIGSLARWSLTSLLPHSAGPFPWATFAVNVSGCLLLGILMVLVMDVWPPSRYIRPFLGVGVLGGYTTFSTYMLDTRALLVAGRAAVAGEYVFGSLAAGLAAVGVGAAATRLAVRGVARRRATWREREQDEPSMAGRVSAAEPAAEPAVAWPGRPTSTTRSTR